MASTQSVFPVAGWSTGSTGLTGGECMVLSGYRKAFNTLMRNGWCLSGPRVRFLTNPDGPCGWSGWRWRGRPPTHGCLRPRPCNLMYVWVGGPRLNLRVTSSKQREAAEDRLPLYHHEDDAIETHGDITVTALTHVFYEPTSWHTHRCVCSRHHLSPNGSSAPDGENHEPFGSSGTIASPGGIS